MNKHNIIISVKNVSKFYQKNKQLLQVIDDVSFSIKKSQITTISGESGAGKSTLLYMMSGLLTPSSGEIYYQDLNFYQLSSNERAKIINSKIGYVFQDFQLLTNFTVLENICLPAKLRCLKEENKFNYHEKALELLAKFNLMHRIKHYPHELSGGEQQRVAILRALINNPEVIFCDEPTGNLDSHNTDLFLKLILELKERFYQTFVLVSHSSRLEKIANTKIHIKDGHI